MESRPKRVKNQGAPAAKNSSCGASGSASRSPSRSSSATSSQRAIRKSALSAVVVSGISHRCSPVTPRTTRVRSSIAISQRTRTRPRGAMVSGKCKTSAASSVIMCPSGLEIVRLPSPDSGRIWVWLPIGSLLQVREVACPDLISCIGAKSGTTRTASWVWISVSNWDYGNKFDDSAVLDFDFFYKADFRIRAGIIDRPQQAYALKARTRNAIQGDGFGTKPVIGERNFPDMPQIAVINTVNWLRAHLAGWRRHILGWRAQGHHLIVQKWLQRLGG